MTITVKYYDFENKKWVQHSEQFPQTMFQIWEFSQPRAQYIPNCLDVVVRDGNHSLNFKLWSGYLRCCGMREFGAISFGDWDPPKDVCKALVKQVFDHPWFKQQRIGALLYTKVKYDNDDAADPNGWEFVESWPGTVTEGGWWYNPNSGNYCCNVTLSFDAEAAVEEDDEDLEDEY